MRLRFDGCNWTSVLCIATLILHTPCLHAGVCAFSGTGHFCFRACRHCGIVVVLHVLAASLCVAASASVLVPASTGDGTAYGNTGPMACACELQVHWIAPALPRQAGFLMVVSFVSFLYINACCIISYLCTCEALQTAPALCPISYACTAYSIRPMSRPGGLGLHYAFSVVQALRAAASAVMYQLGLVQIWTLRTTGGC